MTDEPEDPQNQHELARIKSLSNYYLSAKKPEEQLASMKPKLRQFYERQNEMIEQLEEANRFLQKSNIASTSVESASNNPAIQLAISATFAVNCLLVVLKLVAAVLSGSLVMVASTVDSALDIFSGGIIFVTHFIMHKKDKYRYPVGKSRYENSGLLIFAAVMGFSSLQIIIEGIKDILHNLQVPPTTYDLSIWTLSVFSTVIVLKFGLYLWCRRYRHVSSSCDALYNDHFNDICSNSLSLIFLIIAHFTGAWYLDPVGAILLSLYIIVIWIKTGHHHVTLLAGRSADEKLRSKLIYYAAQFDPLIEMVDTVRVYHAGLRVYVELDVIMPPETPLKQAHDVGEALQIGLESFDEVERAFVHLDYEREHAPEH